MLNHSNTSWQIWKSSIARRLTSAMTGSWNGSRQRSWSWEFDFAKKQFSCTCSMRANRSIVGSLKIFRGRAAVIAGRGWLSKTRKTCRRVAESTSLSQRKSRTVLRVRRSRFQVWFSVIQGKSEIGAILMDTRHSASWVDCASTDSARTDIKVNASATNHLKL